MLARKRCLISICAAPQATTPHVQASKHGGERVEGGRPTCERVYDLHVGTAAAVAPPSPPRIVLMNHEANVEEAL